MKDYIPLILTIILVGGMFLIGSKIQKESYKEGFNDGAWAALREVRSKPDIFFNKMGYRASCDSENDSVLIESNVWISTPSIIKK